MLIRDHFVNNLSHFQKQDNIEGVVYRYVQLRNNGEMKLKELSWIYDYIEDETHDIDLACNAVTYLHSAPHLIDIFNITKKLFKSVATKNSIED